ncbi:hypothetical protein D3C75_761400 [compost metagenome]
MCIVTTASECASVKLAMALGKKDSAMLGAAAISIRPSFNVLMLDAAFAIRSMPIKDCSTSLNSNAASGVGSKRPLIRVKSEIEIRSSRSAMRRVTTGCVTSSISAAPVTVLRTMMARNASR